jgi:alpha-ketoglutarate-dependent taurine dioxygenase
MTALEIHATDATLGAVVRGIRLADLDDAAWRAIESAFHEFAVLIFPAQHLEAREQVAFARRFGEIEHLYGKAGWIPITNRKSDGTLMADGEAPMQVMRGNEGWHTDSSYMSLAAKASVLSAHTVPTRGGETEWADMRAAYAALDEATRARIEKLSAYHSLKHSQALIGHDDPDKNFYGFHDGDPPLRPLVKVHPVTGVPALYIGRQTIQSASARPRPVDGPCKRYESTYDVRRCSSEHANDWATCVSTSAFLSYGSRWSWPRAYVNFVCKKTLSRALPVSPSQVATAEPTAAST